MHCTNLRGNVISLIAKFRENKTHWRQNRETQNRGIERKIQTKNEYRKQKSKWGWK